MDRNRDARRANMVAANGLSRRRHRGSSLRDSPEEDGPVELQETTRLRDRGGSGKKERDRDRDRDRDRERERERDRLSRSKRRRADRLLHSREDGGEESSEESVNDEEDDEDDDGAASMRMLPPNQAPLSSSATGISNHRKSFPPPAKVFRAAPAWKAADEMIGVSVPRKARSASTKRSHECWAASASGVGAEQIHRQSSTSPVRPGLVSITAAAAAASPTPASPSSSNASMRKKMKPNGPKLRPPKSSSRSSSSAQDEIEIEIAEVLYGMQRQPLGPSKQEILASDSVKFDPREASNKSSGDAKSRVSSPISNSQAVPQSSSFPTQNSSSSVSLMSAVVAPKRKKPRAVKYDENPFILPDRNSPISTTTKSEIDQSAMIEASSSPIMEKNPGSAAVNGGVRHDLANPQAGMPSSEVAPESTTKPESNHLSDSNHLTEESEGKEAGASKEEAPKSPKKESPVVRVDDNRDDVKSNKANSTISEVETHKEEKFQIDLMAPPPPPLRSSPERDGEMDFVAVDPKSMVRDVEAESRPVVKEDEKEVQMVKEEAADVESEKAKSLAAEEAESHKPVVPHKERNIDLQVDLEKTDRDSGTASVSGNSKSQHHAQKQHQPQHSNSERSAQTSSVPMQMSVPGWPGGLPPMGYMAPLQGVVSMDGSTVSPAPLQPPHLLFTQPRPKRCATHCYIARNILYHQQIARMNPFWPTAAGSASLYGAKPCNLNAVPPAELGNITGRGVNTAQDKGQGLAMFPGHTGKDKGSQAAANMVDASQRKQILLQQPLPPGAPSNILHGPTFIFPLSQQQAAAAASARSGSLKSPPAAGSAASSSASNSAAVSASGTAAAAAPAMSFNYPNMPGNETQYLAIVQNNGYPFPIPAHVGAPPAYRGSHAQAMPFFNGSFYPSQMLHPSQIHHQHHHHHQQQQQQQPPQLQQSLQAHQNASISSGGSSSSQKHLQNQQQRPHGNGVNGGSGNAQGFPAPKNQSSQQPQVQQQQQRQQPQNQHMSHQARQLESEIGGEDSPSTADSRVSRGNMSIYGQNYAMPINPSNFALMTPAMSGASGATSASGNHTEKKHQHGSKGGADTLSSQAFPMSFAPMNGGTATPGLDMSSIVHNHAFLPGNYQFMTAASAQAAHQKKNYRVSEDGKTGGADSANVEEERKAMTVKASATVGQSIAFSRPELVDTSLTTVKGNSVIDSSARSLNLGSTSGRNSGSVIPSAMNTVSAPGSQQQQLQQRNQQQQQMIRQKQNPFAVAVAPAARSKTPATSNGSVYSDHHLPSSSCMATKFSNSLSTFPQNLVQASSNGPAQSPQWKNPVRTSTSQVPSPPLSSSTSSSHKNHPQQQGRTQQSHTQISFGANSKSSTPQGQQTPSSNQSPSPSVMVGSPTASSMSKGAVGSPRTSASTSTTNKAGQAASLSSQPAKNAPSVPSRKSSPVGGRSVPSILGNPHINSTSSSAAKSQLSQQQQQQQQQQQFSKQALQAQLFFSSPYLQHSTGATSASSPTSAYFLSRNRRDQQQQPQGSSGASSTGMLSLCPPVTLVNTSTSDPAKVVAAASAASNMKGGGLPAQGILHVTQFGAPQPSGNPHPMLSPSFSYVHAVPTPVQVKPAEQKQPAA